MNKTKQLQSIKHLKKSIDVVIDPRYAIKHFNVNKQIFRREVGEIADVISFQKEFLGRKELSDLQMDAYRAVWGEKGGEWSTNYHEIVLLVGMKGGKNFWAEGDLAYLIYILSSLNYPHQFLSKLTKRKVPYTLEKNFDIINVSSVGEQQARRAFFQSVEKVLRSTKDPKSGENFFEKYAGLDISDNSKHFKSNEIIFPNKNKACGNIRLLSFCSSPSSPEGYHMLRFYADELSRADTEAKYKRAKDLYQLGLNNTRSSFPNNIGKVIAWSYPNDTDFDLTYERYQKSLQSDWIHGVRACTWKFNPSLSPDTFENQRKEDPNNYRRVYMCRKNVSRQNYFQPHTHKIDEMFIESITNPIEYRIVETSSSTQTGSSTEHLKYFTEIEFLSITGDLRPRCFAFDPSLNKDRFVIVGGYPEIIDPTKLECFDREDDKIKNPNFRMVIDIIIVMDPKSNSPINYLVLGDLFTKLIKKFPGTYSINSDRYQNETLKQQINKQGILSKSYSFSSAQQRMFYEELRRNIWNNNIKVCPDNTQLIVAKKGITVSELLKREANQLIDHNGRIDHPPNGSKDILDAIVIVNHDIMNLEYKIASLDIDAISEPHKSAMRKKINECRAIIRSENRSTKKIDAIPRLMEMSKLPKHVIEYFLFDAEEGGADLNPENI